MTVLECRGLGVRRGGALIIDGLDLAVGPGEWVTIVGPNGAGKTTLLHVFAGLVPATGRVAVCGKDPATSSRRALSRLVALMPQQPVVPPGMTVRELVGLGRTPHRHGFAGESRADRDAVHDALTRLELRDLAEREVDTLSGGELQRVILARSLCQEPRVLLLDEPTSALDIGHQQTVLDLVDQLRVERGLTVLAAMHDLTLAAQYADRMVLLDHGSKVLDGPPAAVLDPAMLGAVYGARVEVVDRPGGLAVVPVRGRARA